MLITSSNLRVNEEEIQPNVAVLSLYELDGICL